MELTQVLRREHEIICDALRLLDTAATRLQQGTPGAAEASRRLLEFFRSFADENHHGKEEGILFPALATVGLGPDGGPVAMMLSEHDEGRQLLRSCGEALASLDDRTTRQRFGEAARRYISLLSQHIDKENEILFRMADQLLGPEQCRAVDEACAAHQLAKPGETERWERLLGEMAALTSIKQGATVEG